MNNEPLELARVELAGLTGRNPRDGGRANRATILIGPVPGPGCQHRRSRSCNQ